MGLALKYETRSREGKQNRNLDEEKNLIWEYIPRI